MAPFVPAITDGAGNVLYRIFVFLWNWEAISMSALIWLRDMWIAFLIKILPHSDIPYSAIFFVYALFFFAVFGAGMALKMLLGL